MEQQQTPEEQISGKKRSWAAVIVILIAVVCSTWVGIGIGRGFTVSLTLLGVVREILGSGSAFGFKFIEGDGILAFVLAPGAFIALGYLIVLFKKLTSKKAE